MNESTARAERFDLQTSTSSFFHWEVPQKPVAVRIPHQLMDRLEREAVDSFRSVTSKGSEIGGLLIGSVAPGSPLVVSVAEFELIECDYSRGPLYRLAENDLQRFERAIEQRLSSGAAIAGFFRTHTRKGISLDHDDLSVLDTHFRDPHQFALLVRPFATKASTGAIFIREGGKISGDASYLEFPFRSPEHDSSAPLDHDAKPAPNPPTPQAPPAVKIAPRAQIVPIASRRDTATASPASDEKAPEVIAPPVTASAVEPKLAEPKPVESKPVESSAVERKAVEAKTTEPENKTAAKVEPKPEPKVEKALVREQKPLAKAPAQELLPEPAAKSSKSLKLVLAALAASVLFVALFVYPGLLRQSSKAPVATQVDGSPLQLRVERTNGDLLLTWNKETDAIRKATKAMLTINDGEQHENIEMDLAQLRIGSIMYSPQTADISFKMEVLGKDASKTTSESVRVLRTRPSPLQEQSSTVAKPGQPVTPPAGTPAPTAPGATPAAAAATPATPTPDPNAAPETKPVVPTRSFNAQSLSARLRPAQPTDLPEAPVAGGAILSAPIAGVNLNSVGATPNVPVPSPANAQAAPRAGGQIQQAVLVFKKDPEYPKLARQTGARGEVKLTATVGRDGKVKSVRVISGHPMLQAAAKEAVMQWIYKPTLLNGQPVETDTEIRLNFLGDR